MPPSSPMSPMSPKSQSSSLAQTNSRPNSPKAVGADLDYRQEVVTNLTQQYYKGDVVPPVTKAQCLRAQKFAAIYYYALNLIFLVYAFFVPALADGPYYGGLSLADADVGVPEIIIMCLVLVVPLSRFIVLSWAAEFYQFAVLLFLLESSLLFFTALWWSPGIPVLFVLFLSNYLNMGVSQYYWKDKFADVVKNMEALVPPAPSLVKDTTTLSVFDFSQMAFEFKNLWGFKNFHSDAALFDERCGVFSTKDQMSHVDSLHQAYTQALDPKGKHVPWFRNPNEVWNLNCTCIFGGFLNTFISNAAYAFSGFWIGLTVFGSFPNIFLPIFCSTVVILIFLMSFWMTRYWLRDALGVAVAEKEWLAHDVVKHAAQREEMIYDVLDVTGMVGSSKSKHEPLQLIEGKGRHNIVFMWLCVTCIADFIGESYLAKMYWNVAVETRFMMEALTPYDFKLFYHAKWEIIWQGVLIKSMQNLMLVLSSCFFFGSMYNDAQPMPILLMAVIGATSFLQSVMKLTEAVQFAFTVLGDGSTHRHMFVSEWIVVESLLFVIVNILIWLYLVPLMKNWDLPVAGCIAEFNQVLFPTFCGPGTSITTAKFN